MTRYKSPFTEDKTGAFYYNGNPITELSLENCTLEDYIFTGCDSL